MFRPGLTLIFVRSEGHHIRRLRLHTWAVIILVAVVLGLGGAGFHFGRDYLQIKQARPNVERLEKENHHQQAQLLAFSQKIGQLQAEMEKLTQFNKKVKAVLAVPGQEEHFTGVGGPAADLSRPAEGLAQQRKELLRRMHEELDGLNHEASLAEQTQQELAAFLESRKSILAATPSIWPTRGWVTSGFGARLSPFTGRREFHKGLDIANKVGTPVMAPSAGIVAKVDWESGYGRCVTVHHGYGLITRYAHLSKTLVKPGQVVKRGQRLALMGSSGRSSGSHLHYEVLLNGLPVNPSRYIITQ